MKIKFPTGMANATTSTELSESEERMWQQLALAHYVGSLNMRLIQPANGVYWADDTMSGAIEYADAAMRVIIKRTR